MEEENHSKPERYTLSFKVESRLVNTYFGDWSSVAEDLEKMAVGQICSMLTIYQGRSKVEEYLGELKEAFGDRDKDYDISIQGVEGRRGHKINVRRLK